jgi:enoyl-CoA hydratase/carnithine racemase
MSVVETERHGQVLVVRMNRPERLNALNHEMRTQLGRDLDRIPPQRRA